MTDVRDARKKMKIATAVLVLVDVAAAAVLFSPLVGSEQSRRDQLEQLWRELQQKTHEIEPLRDVDKKVAAGKVRFVMPHSIGRAIVRDDVPIELVREAVQVLS